MTAGTAMSVLTPPRPRGRRGPGAGLVTAGVMTLLSAALAYHPPMASAGYYPFIAGLGGANPFYYPPPPPTRFADGGVHPLLGLAGHLGPPLGPMAPMGQGSATFLPALTGWDGTPSGPSGPSGPGGPGLYASRYAASALPVLPMPMPLPLAALASPFAHQHHPAHRFYVGGAHGAGIRGRPALIPTPYAKFSAHAASGSADKQQAVGAAGAPGLGAGPNALGGPEPGFYGKAGTGSQDLRDRTSFSEDKASIGFYGRPL